jgi:DNA-directed RNA polymerase specialized sigma subunit
VEGNPGLQPGPFIEDLTVHERDGEQLSSRHSFDERYLSSSHGQVYGRIEDDDCVMPNTLTEDERHIVVMLYRDFRQTEIARLLGIDKRQMERAMRSIRAKLADWRPDVAEAPASIPVV